MSVEDLARRNGFILLAVVGIVIGFSVVGGIVAPKPITGCNPTMDGVWNANEKWEEAEWTFIEYIIPDVEHLPANNYFYIHVDEDYLYICADLVSDITGDSDPAEWFSVWIDTDDSHYSFSESNWNKNVDMMNGGSPVKSDDPEEADGAMMFFYNITSDTFNESYSYYSYELDSQMDFETNLNESNTVVEAGFQSTINGALPHRVFEVRIDITALYNFNPDAFGIAFKGYGTMLSHPVAKTQYWGAPTYFIWGMYEYDTVFEDSYFQCNTTYIQGTIIETN
jgi:hypothetical protein